MNYKEIKAKLNEIGLTTQKLGIYAQNGECCIYDDETGDDTEYDVAGMLAEHFGKVHIAETSYFHDGYECWVVYEFMDHDVFIRLDSYFSSYETSEWNDMCEVLPEQQTITVYNKK